MKYIITVFGLGIYLLWVSFWISGDIDQGIRGGTYLRSESHGRTIIHYYLGGTHVTDQGNLSNASVVQLFSFVLLGIGLVIGILLMIGSKGEITVGGLIAHILGIAFMTSIASVLLGPLVAFPLRSATPEQVWTWMIPVTVIGFFVFLFVAGKVEKS